MSLISLQTDDPNVRNIGKYSYNSRFCLGEGSYGKVKLQSQFKVFLGTDNKTNQQVAIK